MQQVFDRNLNQVSTLCGLKTHGKNIPQARQALFK